MRVILLILMFLSLDSRSDVTQVKFWAGLPGPSDYHAHLLAEALELTKEAYGDYQLETSYMAFSSGRSQMEMSKGDKINIKVGPPFFKDEKELITVPVALDKGLLGYRVLIIRAADKRKFDGIHSLDALKKQVVVGQELGWTDTEIYQENGVRVVTTPKFEFLGNMLMNRRFDAIPLGIEEVDYFYRSLFTAEEQAVTYDKLLVYYDMALAFQISKSVPELAKRVEAGLLQLIANGRFETLFQEHYTNSIQALSGRRIICLKGGAPYWSAAAKAEFFLQHIQNTCNRP